MKNFSTVLKYSLIPKFNKKFLIFVIVVFAIEFALANAYPLYNEYIKDDESALVYIYSENNVDELVTLLNVANSGYEFKASDSTSKDVLDLDKTEYLINLDEAKVFGTSELDFADSSIFSELIKTSNLSNIVSDANLTNEQVKQILTLDKYDFELVSKDADSLSTTKKLLAAINTVIVFILYFIFMLVSNFIGTEIYEEKSSRAMELIIPNTTPKAHFMAKITSNILYLLAIIGIFILGTIGSLIFVVNVYDYDVFSIINIAKTQLTTTGFIGESATIDFNIIAVYLITLLLLFIISFLFTSIIMGIAASITVSMEDYQKVSGISLLIVLVPFVLSITDLPDVAKFWLSFIPNFAIFLLPDLLTGDFVSIYFVIIIIFVQLVYLGLLIYFGSKVYAEGLLNYSDRPLKQVVKGAFK